MWYDGLKGNIAVSTRLRLARNIEGIPFPCRINEQQLNDLNNKIVSAVMDSNSNISEMLNVVDMGALTDIEAFSMVERHIISPDFAKNRKGRKLICSKDESISIMLGEEDHIRIQVICGGLELKKAYDIANKIDTLISEKLPIAFNSELGYLTQCPTNIGTGLRASVMLHLPSLESADEIKLISDTVSKIGLTVRGIYGEGSSAKASLYQLSNQVTLGITEEESLNNLENITRQIIDKESHLSKSFQKISLEDVIYRAVGTLQNARIISSDEMMSLLSKVMLGCRLEIIDYNRINPLKLMVETQPATLMLKYGNKNPEERDVLRANELRSKTKDIFI